MRARPLLPKRVDECQKRALPRGDVQWQLRAHLRSRVRRLPGGHQLPGRQCQGARMCAGHGALLALAPALARALALSLALAPGPSPSPSAESLFLTLILAPALSLTLPLPLPYAGCAECEHGSVRQVRSG